MNNEVKKDFKHGMSAYYYHKCRCNICSSAVWNYNNSPERKKFMAEYAQRPEQIKKRKEYRENPENKKKKYLRTLEYLKTEHGKQKNKEWRMKEAERHRYRMDTDPEYRKRMSQNALNRYRRLPKEKSKIRQFKTKLKIKYGLTIEQYNAMFESQNGQCKICGKKFDNKMGSGNVDHCHKTGKVRGLLCNGCNVGLGFFKDNIENLKSAAEYLTKYNENV